jgi:hypothetical protein
MGSKAMAKHEFDGSSSCVDCGCRKDCLTTDCPGEPLTDEQREGIEAETLDYFNGQWWLAESAWKERGTEAATDLPKIVVDIRGTSPCAMCGLPIQLRRDETVGGTRPDTKFFARCQQPDCIDGPHVWGDDSSSVIDRWNKLQSDALNVPSKASDSGPTITPTQGEKSDSRPLEARVRALERQVDDILKGRVFRRR